MIKVVLKLEKETKNTMRFTEQSDGAEVIGTLYLKKFAFRNLGSPAEIVVIISNPNEMEEDER